jgi:hypothetical protein
MSDRLARADIHIQNNTGGPFPRISWDLDFSCQKRSIHDSSVALVFITTMETIQWGLGVALPACDTRQRLVIQYMHRILQFSVQAMTPLFLLNFLIDDGWQGSSRRS